MFTNFAMSLKDSASDFVLDQCPMQIILPIASPSKPVQCLQLSLASNGFSSLLRHSSVPTETENILTNSPPNNSIKFELNLHAAPFCLRR